MEDAGIDGSELVLPDVDVGGIIDDVGHSELVKDYVDNAAAAANQSGFFDLSFDGSGEIRVSVDSVLSFFQTLREKMVACGKGAGLVGRLIQEVTTNVELQAAFASPSFNWIRWYNDV